ncbi:MAG: SapC family protein [Xanthomonadales bacterium]|nr:SapC family protein [Xanthomonadales bacterium]
MARYVLLNNVDHHDLRVATHFGAAFGDAVGMVPTYPTEWAEVQREYPIFLRRDSEGQWQSVALLGFEATENLFLRGDRWNADYLPGHVARGPFLIGFQHQQVEGEERRVPVIHVDLDHPRLGAGQGEAVFLPHGGQSPYLDHVVKVLRGIRDGIDASKAMFAAFDALGLIQPVEVEVKFDAEQGAKLTGLSGIDRQRLAELDAEALHGLHRQGYLEGLYLLLASAHNVRRLLAEKQRRLRDAAGSSATGQAA